MSAPEKVADPTPLGNIITGLVLFTLWPVLFGLADTSAMAAILPWALAAAPLVLLTSVQAFKAGNVIGAVANGVLSGVTLVQNGIWGAVVVTYTAAGRSVHAAVHLRHLCPAEKCPHGLLYGGHLPGLYLHGPERPGPLQPAPARRRLRHGLCGLDALFRQCHAHERHSGPQSSALLKP